MTIIMCHVVMHLYNTAILSIKSSQYQQGFDSMIAVNTNCIMNMASLSKLRSHPFKNYRQPYMISIVSRNALINT